MGLDDLIWRCIHQSDDEDFMILFMDLSEMKAPKKERRMWWGKIVHLVLVLHLFISKDSGSNPGDYFSFCCKSHASSSNWCTLLTDLGYSLYSCESMFIVNIICIISSFWWSSMWLMWSVIVLGSRYYYQV